MNVCSKLKHHSFAFKHIWSCKNVGHSDIFGALETLGYVEAGCVCRGHILPKFLKP